MKHEPEERMTPIRVAGVILYRGGAVLLQHRDDDPAIFSPNRWAIFGGHVEPGETALEAARREIQEELGLALPARFPLIYEAEVNNRLRSIFATPLDVPVEDLVLTEGQGMALVPRADLIDLDLVPIHREILDRHFYPWLEDQPSDQG